MGRSGLYQHVRLVVLVSNAVHYVMVWYVMAWYGMVWYSMVWYVWYGMNWYGMAWYEVCLCGCRFCEQISA